MLPVGFGSVALRFDYTQNSDYYIGRENLASQLIPAKEVFNVRVTLMPNKGGWEVSLYGNNILDERYIVSQGTGGFAVPIGAGTNTQVDYGRPRSYGIVASMTF